MGQAGTSLLLSYVVAAMIGERDVLQTGTATHGGRLHWHAWACSHSRWAPKEGLAIMNGTAVMTAGPAGAEPVLISNPSRKHADSEGSCGFGATVNFDPRPSP